MTDTPPRPFQFSDLAEIADSPHLYGPDSPRDIGTCFERFFIAQRAKDRTAAVLALTEMAAFLRLAASLACAAADECEIAAVAVAAKTGQIKEPHHASAHIAEVGYMLGVKPPRWLKR